MDKSKRKKLIIIGSVLLLVGGVVGYVLWKRSKDKKDAEAALLLNPVTDTTITNDYGTGGGTGTSSGGGTESPVAVSTTPPVAPTVDQKAKSFADLKKYFYPQGVTSNLNPIEKTMTINGRSRKIQFYADGSFYILTLKADKSAYIVGEIGQSGWYTNSGRTLTVRAGKNKGYTFTSKNVIATIKKSLGV